jgi:hypothetical protein
MIGGMSGSLGGLVASHNKGGTYLRRRSIPTDPSSAAQVIIRGLLGNLAQEWVNTLTPSERAAWDTYAANVSWVDSLGQTIQLSGINHYIRANVPRLYSEAEAPAGGPATPRIDTAPALFELGVSPQVVAETPAHATGPPEVISLTIDWDNTASYAATDAVLLFVSPPQNPSIRFFKGPYYFVANEAGDNGQIGADLFDSVTPSRYQLRFGPVVTAQAVFWALRASMTDGRLSSLVRGGPVTIPVAS